MTDTEQLVFSLWKPETWKVPWPEGEHGRARLERFELTEEAARRERMFMTFSGHGYRAPEPGTYTRLMVDNVLWMSDTRAEVYDHQAALRHIHALGGRVLLNGLGLGMMLRAVLASPDVTHVDVVELDPDVVALVGPNFADDPRVVIHVADALTVEWPKGTRWDSAWHDIWDTITTDDDDTRAKLNRRYGQRVDWQGGWAADEVRALRRRGW